MFVQEKVAGVQPIPAQSANFRFNHTMVRIKDPRKSLAFYTGILGMHLLQQVEYAEMRFTLYFLGYINCGDKMPIEPSDRSEWIFNQQGLLELTHNWGSENQADFQYHNGNTEPQGYGHICISVPNLSEAVSWFDQQKVAFNKRPEQGQMANIAFIKDPDGYAIEIVQASLNKNLVG